MAQLIKLNGAYHSPEEMLSPPLRVLESRVYRGPHLYSHSPMIRIQVDLGILEQWPTNRLGEFNDRLLEILPGLAQHGCSLGKPGGFVERLKEGTWMGHVLEHVALELQTLAGSNVTRGKTRSVKGKPGHYNILYTYRCEEVGLAAGRLAFDLISALLPSPFNHFKYLDRIQESLGENPLDMESNIAALKRIVHRVWLGPTTESLVEEAERRNIPWRRIDNRSLIQLGTGRYQKILRASISSDTSNLAVETASDKVLTKQILAEMGVPVPKGDMVRTAEGACEAASETGYPVAIKPLDGNHGRGVSTNLKSPEEITAAFTRAQMHSKYVIVEEHYTGRDYRVLVVKGEVAAVSERVPAHVIGDGIHTIAQLIDRVNADPRRGDGHENVMTRIKVDETLHAWLARSGLTLETIPNRRKRIVLAATANLSTGGTAIDRTDTIHPDNAAIARRAALAVGLDIAGIDMVLPDITRSWKETGGGIVEVNAAPGFRMHLHPAEGQPRNVARAVMNALYPEGAKTHVPVVCVTGTNGKSTTVRMVVHIMRHTGLRVGFTSTSGVFVEDECIWKGDASGPKSARTLLRDPTIDIAVLETARGGIVREGLGVKECDVGAVLNVTEDHIGIGGVESIEDLAAVKSVIAESVQPDGISVLNADDTHTLAMAKHAGGSVCFFSMNPAHNSILGEHIEKGGLAVTCELQGGSQQIILHRGGQRIPIIGVKEIPATHDGQAIFNAANALAATAIATALKVEPYTIRAALSSFASNYEQNPGRFNIYDGHGFRVIMDYAHNAAALAALFEMVRSMRPQYHRIIGHLGVPGDRRDEDIREAGRIAARELDLAVFRESPDLRGRAKGEILRLLAEGAKEAGCSDSQIVCVHTEQEATDVCMQRAQAGDLVILMPSEVEKTWQQMLAFKPTTIAERQILGTTLEHYLHG